ncbi:MAG: hypothetical protein QOD55_2266 [Solirubrobacteraceae bacterium]|nr:hypothetical protein [Solirubrobacteraceae bacterium]MEA2290269.1 hypothetical protein [Solirubrobacteraceae bacterium]
MNHLLRSLAPVTGRGWELLEEEARRQLTAALAARKLVDFSGPRGWEHSATNLGRTDDAGRLVDGVVARRRRVLALVEPRADFSLSREELAAADRGAEDPDLDPLGRAARRLALSENIAVLHGREELGMPGVTAASPHRPIALSDDMQACPRHVAEAVELLLGCGVGGPYGLALGPGVYTQVIQTTEHGGYPLFQHLRHIIGGPLVWAPGVDGAIVLSLRGGDFLFDCGQDIAIGYDRHDADAVHLYLVESFSFRVATPEAAVALPPAAPHQG